MVVVEEEPAWRTHCCLSVRYDVIHSSTVDDKPKDRWSRWSIISWSTVSNAAERSRSVLYRGFKPKRTCNCKQDHYVAARTGVEPTTLRLSGIDLPNAPPRPYGLTGSTSLWES